MGRNGHQKLGFTLLEIMVASVIGAVVLLAAIEFFMRQQHVFKQQSEQEARQADMRIAIYYLNKDLIKAGYTGTPYGLQAVIHNTIDPPTGTVPPALSALPRSLRPIIRSEYGTFSIPGNLLRLDGQSGDTTIQDAVKIWADFNSDGGFSHISIDVSQGAQVLSCSTVGQIFSSSFWDTASGATVTVLPKGFVIGKKEKGIGEYHAISSVSSTANTISSSTPLLNYYTGPIYGSLKPPDAIGPIWERIYYINYCSDNPASGPYMYDRCLVRRDNYNNTSGVSYTRTQDVARVYLLKIRYDVQNPDPNLYKASNPPPPIIQDVDPNNLGASGLSQFDPCWIVGVRLYLTAIVSTPSNPAAGSPLKVASYMSVSRYVPTRNIQMRDPEWAKPVNCPCPCL